MARAVHLRIERFLPGRLAEVRPATRRELAATMVLTVPIRYWSMKVSAEWPTDRANDAAGPPGPASFPCTRGPATRSPRPTCARIPVPPSVCTMLQRR